MRHKQINAYEPGTYVTFALDDSITAVITAIKYTDRLIYKVAWMDAGTRHTAWVEEYELNLPEDDARTRCGFQPTEKDAPEPPPNPQ